MTRVLLVDDDPAILRALGDALAGTFEVVTAVNGDAAWRYLHDAAFDAVVSDLRMPGMSGGVLCEKIRDAPDISAMPVILVSGEFSPPAFVRYDCYLRKPLNVQSLIEVVQRLVVPGSGRAPGARMS